jgi:hypothetical protein
MRIFGLLTAIQEQLTYYKTSPHRLLRSIYLFQIHDHARFEVLKVIVFVLTCLVSFVSLIGTESLNNLNTRMNLPDLEIAVDFTTVALLEIRTKLPHLYT